MPDAVVNDVLLAHAATAVRSELNAGHRLRLYANGLIPSPSSVLTDFLEASYAGYNSIALDGLAGPLVLQAVGIYEFDFAAVAFQSTDPVGQLVYGWYLTDLTTVKMARLFSAAVLMVAGTILPVAVRPQILDESAD